MDAIIQLKNVFKVYRQGRVEVPALWEFNLAVQPGDFLALCGPSGSGKTTCLNLMGALDQSSSGEVWLDGLELGSLSPRDASRLRRDRLGFVFQTYNLVPVFTAYENVEFILALQRIPASARRKRVLAILKEVGLEGLEDRRPDELSGGQQQRTAIARAIVHAPAVVLADEPTANLDSANAETLLNMMERLNREHGHTFVFSTHDPLVMQRARRVVKLRDGRLESDSDRT